MDTDRRPNVIATAVFLAVVSAVYIALGVFAGWVIWG